jgi:IS1 family transposase
MDELCVRKSPCLWLWVAVSRKWSQVLGFALGHRDRAPLELCWSDVPQDYRRKLVVTDHFEMYRRFFPKEQHRAAGKGSGETSVVESLNTKARAQAHDRRQRQSGLVRRSCGVSRRIETDLIERFFLLVEQHNQSCATRSENSKQTTHSDQ